MTNIPETHCANIGMRMSVLCATLAIIGPLGFTIPYAKDFQRYSTKDNLITVVGIVVIAGAFYTAAAYLGKVAGKIICRKQLKFGGSILVGIGLAISCLVFAAVIIDLTILIAKLLSGQREAPGILALVIIVFGAVPAAFLGVVFGGLVRWRLARVRRRVA